MKQKQLIIAGNLKQAHDHAVERRLLPHEFKYIYSGDVLLDCTDGQLKNIMWVGTWYKRDDIEVIESFIRLRRISIKKRRF